MVTLVVVTYEGCVTYPTHYARRSLLSIISVRWWMMI